MKHRFKPTTAVILVLMSLLSGCVNLKEHQQRQEHRTIEAIRSLGDTNKHIKTSGLYPICYALANVRRYDRLFHCLDRLEENLRNGDNYINSVVNEKYIHTEMHMWRAEAYIDIGKYKEAIESAIKASAWNDTLFHNMKLIQNRRTIAALLGLAYALSGDRENVLKQIQVLEDDSVPGLFGVAHSLFSGVDRVLGGDDIEEQRNVNLAKIYFAMGDYAKAYTVAVQANDKLSGVIGEWLDYGPSRLIGLSDTEIKNSWTWRKMPQLFVLARCQLETGRIGEAKTTYDRLLAVPQTKGNGSIYWVILFDRGRIAEQDGDRKQAIEFYRQAVDVIEAQRSSINTEASKIGFVGDKQAIYRRLIATLFAEGQYAVAFEYIERSKARALVDMLASKQDFAITQGSATEVRALLARADTAEAEGREQGASAEIVRQRSLAVQSRQQLHQQAPELSSLVTVAPVTVQEIQNHLPPDEVLVEYFADSQEVYAFVLTKAGLRGIKLDGEALVADVQNFRQALQDTRSTRTQELAGKLYNRLVQPLEGAINQRNVLIVAHGPLHYLPFNALHDGNSYLIERYSVRQLPSASVLKYLKGVKAQTTGTLLAFGNPDLGDPRLDLKHAQTEAQDLAKVLPNSRALVRKEASESAFKRYGEGFRYLHIASHGTFNADSPLTSALLLAKDSTNDGTLTVGELYSMRLNADLVTLSACETGLGKIANGDDVVGLTRGFLYAGSRSIVASLWKVDDEATAYLMTRFYSALKGTSKREALRLAQIETRKKYPHPYYWAAFQLTGEAN